jgi:hypothetical protein
MWSLTCVRLRGTQSIKQRLDRQELLESDRGYFEGSSWAWVEWYATTVPSEMDLVRHSSLSQEVDFLALDLGAD